MKWSQQQIYRDMALWIWWASKKEVTGNQEKAVKDRSKCHNFIQSYFPLDQVGQSVHKLFYSMTNTFSEEQLEESYYIIKVAIGSS